MCVCGIYASLYANMCVRVRAHRFSASIIYVGRISRSVLISIKVPVAEFLTPTFLLHRFLRVVPRACYHYHHHHRRRHLMNKLLINTEFFMFSL
jgi:hypothetical protein